MVDDNRDRIQPNDVPTNLPFPERHGGAVDGSGLPPCSPAQFSSSLPAPPRVSNLLPPPPRVGTQSAGIDTRGRDSISGPLHDRVTSHPPGSRLMTDNAIPSLVVDGGWLPPRQRQRGTNSRHSDWLHSHRRGSRSPHRGHGRNSSSDKWRYRRTWHQTDRDRSYPSRHRIRESTRSDDEAEDAVPCQSEASSINQLQDDDTSLLPEAGLANETVALAKDKELSEVSSPSADSHLETVMSS